VNLPSTRRSYSPVRFRREMSTHRFCVATYMSRIMRLVTSSYVMSPMMEEEEEEGERMRKEEGGKRTEKRGKRGSAALMRTRSWKKRNFQRREHESKAYPHYLSYDRCWPSKPFHKLVVPEPDYRIPLLLLSIMPPRTPSIDHLYILLVQTDRFPPYWPHQAARRLLLLDGVDDYPELLRVWQEDEDPRSVEWSWEGRDGEDGAARELGEGQGLATEAVEKERSIECGRKVRGIEVDIVAGHDKSVGAKDSKKRMEIGRVTGRAEPKVVGLERRAIDEESMELYRPFGERLHPSRVRRIDHQILD
jgi:hypothetical protein